MDKTPISLQAAARRWADEQREVVDRLPSPEEIVAYHEGKLDPEAEAKFLERLALHPLAKRELLDLKSFADLQPPSEQYRLDDGDVAEALVAMRARIRAETENDPSLDDEQPRPITDESSGSDEVSEPEKSTNDVLVFSARQVRRYRTLAQISALAAVLTLVVSAAWISSEPRDTSEPRYSRVIDVATVRGARPYDVSPNTERVLLLIHGVDLGSYDRGRLELSVEGSGEVLRRHDFAPAPNHDNLLTLELPRDLLADGTYRLEFFGVDAEGDHLVKQHGLTIEGEDVP